MALQTDITRQFGIRHPVMLAGMNIAAGPELAAAVTAAGGLGVFGGVTFTPTLLRAKLQELKDELAARNAPMLFGVDLLLPKVGGSARKTNKDYTEGNLDELVDIIIEFGAKLFVSAVGVPPKQVVERFHAAGIPVMNMIGSPKHVAGCLAAGVDIICAQGGEGGGHTGEVATSVLIPAVADLLRGKNSPLTGKQVPLVAAGGIFDGRGLAMALTLGADAVWVGTRFVASEESGAPKRHKDSVVKAGIHDTFRSLIYTGRPMRIIKNEYAVDWEENRMDEMQQALKAGVIPFQNDMKSDADQEEAMKNMVQRIPLLSGQCAGVIDSVLPAKTIVDDMVAQAVHILQANAGKISKL